MIINSKDRFIRDLRKKYGQSIGNRFIEDAYAYRIS